MKIESTLHATLFVVAMVSGSALLAAPMTRAEYGTVKNRIEAEFKDSKAACNKFTDNVKDVCREEAKAKEKVARAELEYNRSGTPKDAAKLATVRADTAYDVARERCDDRSGSDKAACVGEAKTAHTKALADAKLAQKVGDARRDAADDKREADYNLAKEKCEALAGANKASCLATAKANYGKS
jgi:hypothetical protein